MRGMEENLELDPRGAKAGSSHGQLAGWPAGWPAAPGFCQEIPERLLVDGLGGQAEVRRGAVSKTSDTLTLEGERLGGWGQFSRREG